MIRCIRSVESVAATDQPGPHVSPATPTDVPDVVPARLLNEHVYCPRLAYLEWVDHAFRDNADTLEGSFAHRRAHRERGSLPKPEELVDQEGDLPPTTAVTVSSERLGIIAKLDVLELRDGSVRPVEYKRGEPKSDEEPLWEPELVQLCAQVLLLEDAGYAVSGAEVFFAGSRTRHAVEIKGELVERTRSAVAELRSNAARDEPPPPLVDSPKCPRCSLVGICLPDEVNLLRGAAEKPQRRLVARDDPARPLYATTQGTRVTKRRDRIVLMEDGAETASKRLIDVSHVAVFGNVSVGSALLRELFDRGIPVLWFSYGGWFAGVATGMPPKNVELRIRQHRAAAIGDPGFAAAFVSGKIKNCRTLLRRHGASSELLKQLAALATGAAEERSLEAMLGLEGTAARLYFPQFGKLLARDAELGDFRFDQRSRRPPTDRTNALLSFVYAMLIKDATVALLAAGFDPFVGLYHRVRFGRPALALDLAEEFRPLIADSTVLTAIRNGEVQTDDFVERAGAVSMKERGRRKLIAAYERRMATELHHPTFGYQASYRRSLEIQARMLAATLVGDCPEYRPLTTR